MAEEKPICATIGITRVSFACLLSSKRVTHILSVHHKCAINKSQWQFHEGALWESFKGEEWEEQGRCRPWTSAVHTIKCINVSVVERAQLRSTLDWDSSNSFATHNKRGKLLWECSFLHLNTLVMCCWLIWLGMDGWTESTSILSRINKNLERFLLKL